MMLETMKWQKAIISWESEVNTFLSSIPYTKLVHYLIGARIE
jgi:hypothetical protein